MFSKIESDIYINKMYYHINKISNNNYDFYFMATKLFLYENL